MLKTAPILTTGSGFEKRIDESLQLRKRAVVISCVHVPNCDDKALYAFEELLTELSSAEETLGNLTLFIAGDFLDCFEISSFNKVPNTRPGIRAEIEYGRELLKEWRRIMGSQRIVYTEGNHELRLRKFIVSQAPEIYDIAPTLPHLLDLAFLNIEWVGLPEHLAQFKDSFVEWEGVLIGHFNKYNKHSGYAAKAIVEDKGCSIVAGHGHKAAIHTKTLYGKQLFGIETGCLCRLDNSHEISPNWQQAITVLTSENGIVHPELLIVQDGKVCWGGKIFGK